MELFIFLLVLSLFNFQTSSANKDTLPVFLIDSENVMSHLNVQPNPFVKMTASLFADIIHDAIKRSEFVIIFVEDKLCSEDISLKDKLGSPYYHLHQGLLNKKVKYVPAVTEPYKILTQIFRTRQFNVLYLSSGVKLQLHDNSKYLYIFFQDGINDTRAQSLRNHDIIMQEVYFTVRQLKTGPIIAFYTGKVNPIVTEKVEFIPIKPKAVPKDLGVMLVTEGALFRFSGVFSASSLRRAACNQRPLIAEETWTRRKLTTKMAYTDFELQFNFSFGDDDWLLDHVALLEGGEEVGRTDMGVGAPWNWSYVCGEPLSVINTRDGSAITISQYQIQPKFRQDPGEPEGGEPAAPGSSDDSTKCFGKTVNCGPYFNTHILSGLFITFILMGVLTYGVLMLYNCGSNDKYDDPSGKEVLTNMDQH